MSFKNIVNLKYNYFINSLQIILNLNIINFKNLVFFCFILMKTTIVITVNNILYLLQINIYIYIYI